VIEVTQFEFDWLAQRGIAKEFIKQTKKQGATNE
jgi:hypothetical protein